MGLAQAQQLTIKEYMIKIFSVTSGTAVNSSNPQLYLAQQKSIMIYDTLKASTSYQSTDYMKERFSVKNQAIKLLSKQHCLYIL